MTLWLDTTDDTSLHVGNQTGSVTLWEDLSGLSNHAVMTYLPRAPTVLLNAIGPETALMFVNEQSMELTNMQCMAGITGITYVVVFRLGNTVPLSMPFANVGPDTNSESLQFGSALNWEGNMYETIGSTDRINPGSNATLGIAINKTIMLCITGDATDGTRMYINGTQVATWPYGGGYTDYLWSVGRTHGKGFGTLNWYFQGIIGEIRIYDHRLLSAELSALFGALNAKWNVSMPPRPRVPGMALWFDATDASSIHLGNKTGSVATWEDLSGLSNHAVMYSLARAPTIATNAIGTSNALMFNDQHLELTNMQAMAGLTGVTFMIVFRLGNTVPIVTPFGNVGVDMNAQSVQFGGALNWLNEAYEIIGSSTRLNLGSYAALGIAANKTHVMCISGDASDKTRMYINGIEVASWTYGGDYTTYLWAVGREHGKMFGFPNGWLCFQGAIGEIRIYDHRLSLMERQSTFSEMASKWSVTIAPQIVVFSGSPSALPPRTRVAGMALWFDATDASTIHYGSESGSVAVWEDLSGLGNHAVMYSLSRAPKIAYNAIGLSNALMFNDQHLELTHQQCMAGITGLTFMVVFRLGNTIPIITPFGNVGPDMNTESVQYGSHLNWLDEAYEIIGSSDRINLHSNAALGIAANKTHLICISGDASDMTRMYFSGTQVATWPYGGDYTNYLWAVGRTYGKLFGFATGWLCFQGAIGEIRIYDHRLSSIERQLAFVELGSKWSVSIAAQVDVFSGSPSALPLRARVTGMALWLDSKNATSVHYGDTNGSVSVWEDLSGLSNHAVMYSLARAPRIASNAIGSSTALTFSNQHLELTNKQCMAGITGVTFMIVFRLGGTLSVTTPFGNVGVNMTTEATKYGSALNYSGTFFENIGSSDRQTVGSSTALGFATNKTHLLCIAGDPTNGTTMYVNGTQVATWTYGSGYTNYMWAIGRTHGLGFGASNWYFEGTIGEIRIYDHRLSNADLTTTQSELLSKWV